MTPLLDFLPQLRILVPQAPNPVALQALRLSAHDFCKETRLWRKTAVVPVTSNPFSLSDPYTMVVAVERAIWNTAKLTPKAYADIDLTEFTATGGGTPDIITEEIPGAFVILPFMAGTVSASVYLLEIMILFEQFLQFRVLPLIFACYFLHTLAIRFTNSQFPF